MNAIVWLLTHWPDTVALSGANREIRAELKLRAICAETGDPSPHQPPPHLLDCLAVLVLVMAALWLAANAKW